MFNNPCKNRATCQFKSGSIKCLCPYGFTGVNCEKKVCDEKNPCLNNGVCIMDESYVNYSDKDEDLKGVKCFCKPGYEGVRCEKVRYVLGCPPINPCLNNGHCIDKPFGFECICHHKFSGKRCEIEKKLSNLSPKVKTTKIHDQCLSRKYHCKNKGVCMTTVRGVKCQCLPDYTGIYCEYKLFNKKSIRKKTHDQSKVPFL